MTQAKILPSKLNLKRLMLQVLVVSVLLGALIGVIIVLRDEFSWFEIRVVLTTVTLAVASLCGLTCDLSRTPQGLNLLPAIGLGLTLLTTLLMLFGIWFEPDTEVYWKPVFVLVTATFSAIHASLLSLIKLPQRFKWVQWIAWQVIFGMFALISIAIVLELDSKGVFRTILIVAILDVAITLLIPLLHRIGRVDRRGEDLSTLLESRNVQLIDEEIGKLRAQITRLEKVRNQMVDQSGAN